MSYTLKKTMFLLGGIFLLSIWLNEENGRSLVNISVTPKHAKIERLPSYNQSKAQNYVKISSLNYKTRIVDAKNQVSVKLEPALFLDINDDRTYYIDNVAVVFKAIPEGTFMMGSTTSEREKPVHKVHVNGFRLMEHEVTWEIYQICIAEGVCGLNEMSAQHTKKHPVNSVSWNQINDTFIPWFNRKTRSKFRLPSEAEWEYAAKSGNNTKFSWGGEVGSNKANCWGCQSAWDYQSTAPVKSFLANKFGIYDMHGNLWEWVSDCFSSYAESPRDSLPQQTIGCDRRVLRGGSYKFKPAYITTSFRGRDKKNIKSNGDGFSLAQG